MAERINYDGGIVGGKSSAQALTTSEADVVVLSDLQYTNKSQISVFYKWTAGAATSVKLRYYFSLDGTTWFQVPIKNAASGILVATPSVIDSTSPSPSAGVYQVEEDIPFSAAPQFKVTAQSVGAVSTLDCYVCVRDN